MNKVHFLRSRLAAARLLLFALLALILAGCNMPVAAPPAAADEPTAAEATEPPAEEGTIPLEAAPDFVASITLPDGMVCLNAGEGGTLSFDEARVNYTCDVTKDGDVVLLGDLESPMLDQLIVTQGLLTRGDDGFELTDSAEVTMRMAKVTLADGMECLNAGQGATIGFDDKRVNFTCKTTEDGDWVLLGDFQADGTTLMVERGFVVPGEGDAGFSLEESEMLSVALIVGEAAD